jgi:hypothetical protein
MKKHILKENYERFFGKRESVEPTIFNPEKHQTEEKESINETLTGKLQVPKDVSYYDRDWSKVFDTWANARYGPSESDMYDWKSRANYQAATTEYNKHMTKVANKLNVAARGLDEASQKWRHILAKHRRNDRR